MYGARSLLQRYIGRTRTLRRRFAFAQGCQIDNSTHWRPCDQRALRKRLRLRPACSAASASRASKPDMDGLKSASSFTAGVWRRNEEKWRLLWAAFVAVWLASSSTLATTSSMRATISAASLVAGYFHNHIMKKLLHYYINYPRHPRHITPACPGNMQRTLSGRCNSAW